MLEDDFIWMFRKALAGNGLNAAEAAERAGVAAGAVEDLLGGAFSESTARALAGVLGLSAEACAGHAGYAPKPLESGVITRLDLPFGDERVNAWQVCDGGECLLFDAGFGPDDLIRSVDGCCGKLPDRVFITHGHRDHVGGLLPLRQAGLPVHAPGLADTMPVEAGSVVICGRLVVRACDLSGHFTPALGYWIEGLERPVLVVGDALYAGSMGGCPDPAAYQHALARLREVLGPLPDETVILPGHGPATTLGEERVANPFL